MKRIIVFFVLLVFAWPAYGQEMMLEGLWELKTTISIPGSPQAIPPQTIKHCYTKAEAQKQADGVPANKDCKMTKHNVTGNKVTWEMVCTGQQKGTMTGEVIQGKGTTQSRTKSTLNGMTTETYTETTYGKDTMQSRTKSTMQGMTTETQTTGKRLGNCPS